MGARLGLVGLRVGELVGLRVGSAVGIFLVLILEMFNTKDGDSVKNTLPLSSTAIPVVYIN